MRDLSPDLKATVCYYGVAWSTQPTDSADPITESHAANSTKTECEPAARPDLWPFVGDPTPGQRIKAAAI